MLDKILFKKAFPKIEKLEEDDEETTKRLKEQAKRKLEQIKAKMNKENASKSSVRK